MKWIRWDGDCWFDLRDTKPSSLTELDYKNYLYEVFIDCEKDTNWREIESGVLDTETGKLRITLKPVVKKEQVANVEIRFPANGDHDSLAVYGFMQDGSFARNVAKRGSKLWQEFFDARHEYGNVSRAAEASTPANPYTKEAVDELLEATEKAHADYFRESTWIGDPHKRMARALTALKKQREAANGG